MKTRLIFVLLLVPFLSSAAPKAKVDEALAMIEQYAHGKRIAGGFILSGVAMGYGLGAFLASRSDYPETRTTGAITMGITAGAFGVMGISSFFVPTDLEIVPKKYRETKVNAEIGERYLLQLRDQARTHRLIGMTTVLAAGLAELAVFVGSDRSAGNNWLIYSGAGLVGLGTFGLVFFETIPEKAYDKYFGEKIAFSIAPINDGAVATFAARF